MTSFDTTQIPTSSLTLDEVDCTYSTLIPQDDLSDRVSHSFQSPTVALLNRLKDLFEQQQETQWPSKKWPTQRAYKDAYKFITLLPLMDIPEPEIRFADDGEINFYGISTVFKSMLIWVSMVQVDIRSMGVIHKEMKF